MFRVILWQVGATLVAVLLASVLFGVEGGASAAIGGGVCFAPNLLFALRLKRATNRPDASYPIHFFLGEFIKLALVIGLLVLAGKCYADLHWPSLLIGLGLAVQAGFIAFGEKARSCPLITKRQ